MGACFPLEEGKGGVKAIDRVGTTSWGEKEWG